MNKDELYALIADTLNRQDLTAQIPMFVKLAEAQMDREITTRQEFGIKQFSGISGSAGLPCDFGGVIAITAFGQPNRPIVYLSPDKFDEQWLSSNGAPHYYTLTNSQILFSPSVDFDGSMRYWKLIPRLGEGCDTNWLLQRHPDAYLYGALMNAAPYLKDDQRIGVWGQFYQNAIDAINTQSVRQQAGAHLQIQNRSVV